MAAFTYVVATTKSAYDTFLTALAATVTAQAAVTSHGAIPSYPTITVAAADWNNVTTSRATWQATYDTLAAAVVTAQAAQRTAELAVLTTLGYIPSGGTQYTEGVMYREWVKVVGAGAGILTYTNWIGFSETDTALTISTTEPTQAFPKI